MIFLRQGAGSVTKDAAKCVVMCDIASVLSKFDCSLYMLKRFLYKYQCFDP